MSSLSCNHPLKVAAFLRKLYYLFPQYGTKVAFLLEIEIYCRLATLTRAAQQMCSYLRSDGNAGRRKLS
jgi:hypothetical protein